MSSNFVKEQKQIDLFKIYVSKFFFYLKKKQLNEQIRSIEVKDGFILIFLTTVDE